MPQAKVAEELAAATAQVSQLQLELTAHQKKEMDLRKQLSAALQDAERHETQLSKLQAQLAGKTSWVYSIPAPLCHYFSSFISHRFFLSSGVSIPAFPRISHRASKKGVDALNCPKGVCILVTTTRRVGQIKDQNHPVAGMPSAEPISWHYCLRPCRGTRDIPLVEKLR